METPTEKSAKPLPENSESPLEIICPYRFAQYIPEIGWHVMPMECDYEDIEILGRLCLELERKFRVKNVITQEIVDIHNGIEFAYLLNLFSNRITDRNGISTE